MKIAYLSPLPPARSGIASYSAILLPALREYFEITAVVDQQETAKLSRVAVISIDDYRKRRDSFDGAIYQLGNNPFHEFIYGEAMERPGVIVLHDVVLHHLLVEMTLARGDAEGFVEVMRRNHGEAGAAWARARAAGLHHELSNFLFPASIEVASRSKGVIVHNQFARDTLLKFGVTTPITVVGHPFQRQARSSDPKVIREELGIAAGERVIGMFGFITEAKRPAVVMEAFAEARKENANLKLLIVGESAPNVEVSQLARRYGVPAGAIRTTGFVADADFDRYLAAADVVVNLRYPTAGETSGAMIHILAAGKPVAVNDYAQFAEWPDAIATKIPFEDEQASLKRFMLEVVASEQLRSAQGAYLDRYGSLAEVSLGYVNAVRGGTAGPNAHRPQHASALALFPELALAASEVSVLNSGRSVRITLRNDGPAGIRSLVWGEPAYRVVIKGFLGDEERSDVWLKLSRDLGPGDQAVLDVSLPADVEIDRLELFHALQDVPSVTPKSFATVGIQR